MIARDFVQAGAPSKIGMISPGAPVADVRVVEQRRESLRKARRARLKIRVARDEALAKVRKEKPDKPEKENNR